MSNTIGVNVVMKGDNSDLVSKANEAKRALGFIQSPAAGSPISSSYQENISNLGSGSTVNSNGFVFDTLVGLNKSILEELKNLNKFLLKRKNGEPASPFDDMGGGNGSTAANLVKGITTALGVGGTAIGGYYKYRAGNKRIALAQMQGDPYGAERAEIDQTTGTVTTATSLLPVIGGVLGSIIPGLGTMAGTALGAAVKSIIDVGVSAYGEDKKGDIDIKEAKLNAYKSSMKLNEQSMLLYDDYNLGNKYAGRNAKSGLTLQDIAANYSINTGMELTEFQTLMNNFSKSGVSDIENAALYARKSALMNDYTTADTTGLYGALARQGFSAEASDLQVKRAYGASKVSGLSKGQFSEFLTGLQSAVEEGISQGFVKSTDDVSKTMVMMSRLSGGDAGWEGKYGFAKLNQMNQGLRNATSLQNSTHLMAMQALRGLNTNEQGVQYLDGQDELNTLALMEGGFNSTTFGAIAKNFSKRFGNDTLDNVLAWKDLTGLNYNGAIKLYKMQQEALKNGTEIDQNEIDRAMASPEFNSDTKNMVNYLNKIAQYTSVLGELDFGEYIRKLEQLYNISEENANNRPFQGSGRRQGSKEFSTDLGKVEFALENSKRDDIIEAIERGNSNNYTEDMINELIKRKVNISEEDIIKQADTIASAITSAMNAITFRVELSND